MSDELPVSAQKIITFCDRQLEAIAKLQAEVESLKRACQSQLDRRDKQ